MGTRAQRAARTGKGHGVVPGFCTSKRSSLGILSPEFCPPPAPYQVQEAERSPEKESIERPKGFSRFGRFRDPDPLRCYTSTLLLYLKTRWRPRRRPPKTSSKQETHKSSSMESGVVTDPANSSSRNSRRRRSLGSFGTAPPATCRRPPTSSSGSTPTGWLWESLAGKQMKRPQRID